MRIINARHHGSIPDKILGLLRRDTPAVEITSFSQHCQYGPGSCKDKIYPTPSLREVFSGNFPSSLSSKETTGLFGYPIFGSSRGFYQCWFLCEAHCEELVKQILSTPPSHKTLKLFDDLSNVICLYADCVQFIGDNAPSKKIAQAAMVCNMNAHNYVEKLNTNVDLYRAIKAVTDNSEITSNLDGEDMVALKSFLHDMALSGIHLPQDIRQRYIKSMAEIAATGEKFIQLAHQPVQIRASEAPSALVDYGIKTSKGQGDYVNLVGSGVDNVMGDVRAFSWRNYHAYDDNKETELMNLLRARLEMSQSVGFSSFAERELQHTMAGSPENVSNFLLTLHSELKPLVDNEIEHIKFAKANDDRHDFDEPNIYPYCGQYYPRFLNEQFLVENHQKGRMFLDMLEIEKVMEGLNVFCEDILKISLVAEAPMRGELVHDDVIKLGVFDEKEGLIGYIYADLFERDDKSPRTCLHTITCGTHSQLPVVVLQCGFIRNPRKIMGQFSYPKINLDQLQTLFHEFGHALHAILGRTRYQTTSGTRGPTDFAEIPSTLFENFISHPQVYYAVIAPFQTFHDSHFQYGTENLFNTPYTALKTETSILYSLLDQQLHCSRLPVLTSDVANELYEKYSHLTPVEGTAWHHRFSHLHYYGARYYSYLWSQSIANLIFYNMFYDDPFNESAGLRLKEFLKRGSSVDFKSSLNELVGYEFGQEDMIGAIVEPMKIFSNSYLDKQDISKKWW